MLEFPLVWKQFDKFLVGGLGVVRHLSDDIIQVVPWIDIVVSACCQQ